MLAMITMTRITSAQFTTMLQQAWRQGEHVAIFGQTGSGKTTIVRDLTKVREYVCVIGVKRNDDTLHTFRDFYHTKSWPPPYDKHKVIIWPRPRDLKDIGYQASRVFQVLDDIFKNGGWCCVIDDTGYVTGELKLSHAITVLLNQGRSSGISMITVITQASSVAARVPSETMRQVRHVVMFPYLGMSDLKGLSNVTGITWTVLRDTMRSMPPHDFLYLHRNSNQLFYVHNTWG